MKACIAVRSGKYGESRGAFNFKAYTFEINQSISLYLLHLQLYFILPQI
ncbi:hypothetical protein [uncultured Pontibacter sp.]|nr:hypothetical protein [uncultured Pontibacter sp.]